MISAYGLHPPASDDDWRAFHDIRDVVLFKGRHVDIVYDRNHPDDRAPENTPLLFKIDGSPVGTVRLDDFGNGTGAVRLVAILGAHQGRGLGRIIAEMTDDRARTQGMHTLFVNAAPEAVGFYESTGWARHEWDAAELVQIGADCIQMCKTLGQTAEP